MDLKDCPPAYFIYIKGFRFGRNTTRTRNENNWTMEVSLKHCSGIVFLDESPNVMKAIQT